MRHEQRRRRGIVLSQNLSPRYSTERRKRATPHPYAPAGLERRSPPPPVAFWPRMCGDRRLLLWRCRLGPLWGLYPGHVRLVEAAWFMWNKVLLVPIHLVVSCSDDGDGLVRWRSTGSVAPDFSDFCVGAFGRQSVALVLAVLRGNARGEAAGSAVDRYVDLASSLPGLRWDGRWDGQIQARICTGCVPSRCLPKFIIPFVAGCCCGSFQSLWAMVLSWVCGWGSFVSAFSGDVDGGSWQGGDSDGYKGTQGLPCIFLFVEGLCVVWMGQLTSLCPLRMRPYVYASLYVCFTW